jgi:hypothetical protein
MYDIYVAHLWACGTVTCALFTAHTTRLFLSPLVLLVSPISPAPQPWSRSHDVARTRWTQTKLGGIILGGFWVSRLVLLSDFLIPSALVSLVWAVSVFTYIALHGYLYISFLSSRVSNLRVLSIPSARHRSRHLCPFARRAHLVTYMNS